MTAPHPFEHPPESSPQELVEHLRPSARFQNVRFDTFQPNPEFPSQEEARTELQHFVDGLQPSSGFRLFRRKAEGRGVYLDGGFGVGKTHLLASTYHAAVQEGVRGVALMSFQDLMYLIGALGMNRAVEIFKGYSLLLIDEFELDDPGNTHMANTFLGQLMPGGTSVVATSNTEPGALGQGRFNAQDFQRQIQGIASRFETRRVDGPDYRHRGTVPEEPLTREEYATWMSRQDPMTSVVVSHRDLNRHLLDIHPSRFARLLESVETLVIEDLMPMPDQNVALRFVHFVDKLYDMGLPAALTGVNLGQVFSETYRHGAYAKKYSRALSRLSELLREARADIRGR